MMNRQLLCLVSIVFISTIVADCQAKKVAPAAAAGTVHEVHVDKLPKRQVNVVERHVHVVEKQHAADGSTSSSTESDTVSTQGYRKVPKLLKMTTKLELCKLECKRQQDEEDAQEYVERLRVELASAEHALQTHVDLMRQQLHQYESQQHHPVPVHHDADEHHQKHA